MNAKTTIKTISIRAAALLAVMMLTSTTARALTVTVVPEGGGTYNVVDGTKLYVTPNTGYYLVSVMRTGTTEPLIAMGTGDEEPYYSVGASDDITINFGAYTNNVQVRFNMKNHGDAIANQNLTLGQTVTRPTPDPTADGYVFLGWFKNSACTTPYDFDTVLDNTLSYSVSNDCYTLTLYAGWIAEADLSGTCGKVDATAEPPLDGSEVTWAVTKSAGSSDYDVLTISGSGAMTDYSKENNRPWHDYRDQIKTVVVEEGVTHISNYAFYNFANVSSAITIPASVTSIGKMAFEHVSESTAAGIHISAANKSALTSIGQAAFNAANASIDLSRCASLNAISNDHVFRAVTKDVTLPSSVTSICKWAFSRYSDGGFTGDHAYVVVPEGKALSVTIDGVTEPVVLVPTDGKADILSCLYADPTNRGASRALTLAMVDMLGDNNYTMTGWDGTTRDVALCRTLPAGKKQTVCLPFAPTALLSLGKVWEFTGIESKKAVMTERTSDLTANTPYIFEANASNPDVTSILFENVAISIGSDPKTVDGKAGFTFHGTYTDKTWEATSDEVVNGTIYGFMAQDNDGQQVGQFVRARRRTHLRPFSCWLEYSGELTDTNPTSQARRTSAEGLPDVIDIVWVSASDGTTTGIADCKSATHDSGIANSLERSEWYSLDGRRLSGEPSAKGVYINNGKKIVIK